MTARANRPLLTGAFILVAIFTAALGVGCTSANSGTVASGQQQADQIIIVKSNHTMTLMAKGSVLKVYKVALGRGPTGPKERQGDHKTPEGEYVIEGKNAHSRFHLALHVSYPNQEEMERARKAGVDPGGLIEIHGLPPEFAWAGSLQHKIDWTDGCIAVSNPEIEEVWRLVQVGTPVEIKP